MKPRAPALVVIAAIAAPGAAPAQVGAPETAATAAAGDARALIRHFPPAEARAGTELRLVAVIDGAWREGGLVVRYRALGSDDYQAAPFQRSSAGGYYAVVPADSVARPGIAYYIEGAERGHVHFATAADPHVVRVERDDASAWIETELHRLGGRRYSMSFDSHYQDLGDNSGRDRYFRGELDWTYRLVGPLYAISVGFGFLDGWTPSGTGDDAIDLERGYRFGYGGVRLRLRDSVWLDGRALIGFGDDGFSPGAGGELILGDDWRTCVKLGVEGSTALSYRAWVTLQWDTVPGLLMSATAATTDEPRAQIDAGSYIVYRLMVPVTDAVMLTGKLSYGARGKRPGGFGGGLATELRF